VAINQLEVTQSSPLGFTAKEGSGVTVAMCALAGPARPLGTRIHGSTGSIAVIGLLNR
jgi:hypothetical protein